MAYDVCSVEEDFCLLIPALHSVFIYYYFFIYFFFKHLEFSAAKEVDSRNVRASSALIWYVL